MLEVNKIESYNSPKILNFNIANQFITKLKSEGKRVGLCNGGFDMLHPGHMKHFEMAKKECDILFVSLTADRFIPSRKGDGRPIYNEKLRSYSIAAIEWVDYVVISDFARGVEVIEQLKPSYYIKGPDYIHKTTPGITSEREAVAKVGGEMRYTTEPPISTTKIIEYIKNEIKGKGVLLVIDRDGTLIENNDFLGREDNWHQELRMKKPVVDYLSSLQTKYGTTKIVVTNQGGVARKYFSCETVKEINKTVNDLLAKKGIIIDNWQYCPNVDSKYAKLKKDELDLDFNYVKEVTRRKPFTTMVEDGLRELGKKFEDFDQILVLGDRHEDGELAANLKAVFIDVNDKSYEELMKESW